MSDFLLNLARRAAELHDTPMLEPAFGPYSFPTPLSGVEPEFEPETIRVDTPIQPYPSEVNENATNAQAQVTERSTPGHSDMMGQNGEPASRSQRMRPSQDPVPEPVKNSGSIQLEPREKQYVAPSTQEVEPAQTEPVIRPTSFRKGLDVPLSIEQEVSPQPEGGDIANDRRTVPPPSVLTQSLSETPGAVETPGKIDSTILPRLPNGAEQGAAAKSVDRPERYSKGDQAGTTAAMPRVEPAPFPDPVRKRVDRAATARMESRSVEVHIGTIEVRAALPAARSSAPAQQPVARSANRGGFGAYASLRNYRTWRGD